MFLVGKCNSNTLYSKCLEGGTKFIPLQTPKKLVLENVKDRLPTSRAGEYDIDQ